MDVEECVQCIGLAEMLPHLVDESLHDAAEYENMDLGQKLDKLNWLMYDSREKILHKIARKICGFHWPDFCNWKRKKLIDFS